eukprot:CAMPEP_0195127824 /NCGR_PEP_ID=MMETSP0448-20130528/137864_1 /TAXON_ID=66468 /ORGANISM="Heterocapsa triquestra, Strain CCMP 448" /LENGTH=41 /DNA_ID= /DNA_START= /DNA_END= /DNA_ORIENTATION=
MSDMVQSLGPLDSPSHTPCPVLNQDRGRRWQASCGVEASKA